MEINGIHLFVVCFTIMYLGYKLDTLGKQKSAKNVVQKLLKYQFRFLNYTIIIVKKTW